MEAIQMINIGIMTIHHPFIFYFFHSLVFFIISAAGLKYEWVVVYENEQYHFEKQKHIPVPKNICLYKYLNLTLVINVDCY